MIALGPRDIVKACAFAILFAGFLHIAERVTAGFAMCPSMGCLPW